MQGIYPWNDISHLSLYLIGDAPVPSSDGRWLVIPDPQPGGPKFQGGTTWLGDLLTGELTSLGRPALAPTWSPDGHRITYVLDETLYVRDVAGEDEPVAIFRQEGLRHRYARWSPTGEWIAVADDAKTEDQTSPFGMWTYWLVSPDGSEVKELGSWLAGGMYAAPQNLDWSPDGKLLLALPSVVVLTLEGQSMEFSEVYENPPDSVPAHLLPGLVGRDKMLDKKRAWLSHGGQQIAYLGQDGVYVFDRESQTDSLIATYDLVGQLVCQSCLQVRWSVDDSLLIVGAQDTADSRKDMYWGRVLALEPEAGSMPELLVEGEDVYLVDVIPDIGGRETSEGAVIDCHPVATGVAFSPDGSILALDRQLWSVGDWALVRQMASTKGGMGNVAFSPDGKMLAAGNASHEVRWWRVADGALLHAVIGHTDSVNSVAFSPSGDVMASGSLDGTVRLWQVPRK